LIGGALRQDGTPKVLVATMCFPLVSSSLVTHAISPAVAEVV
jgi:hypothetical protein